MLGLHQVWPASLAGAVEFDDRNPGLEALLASIQVICYYLLIWCFDIDYNASCSVSVTWNAVKPTDLNTEILQ